MKGTVVALLCAASLPLAACASTRSDDTLALAGTGAAVGAATGAGLGAVTGAYDPITGAVVGAAVGGLAGAYWADQNKDGYADGYVREGQYYQGQPAGYTSTGRCPSTLGSAATGAGVGAAAGAGVGALASGVSVLEGALVGAAVGGVAGAIWADQNQDGCVDGYVREGQYYPGAPMTQPSTSTRTGERG